MKYALSSALLLAGAGAMPSVQASSAAAPLKGKVFKKLTPEYNPKATRAIYMYGPMTLPAANATHAATGMSLNGIKLDPNSDTPGFSFEPPCSDCTVHNAMANFAFKDGRQADVKDGVYIHHIIILDFSGKSQLMPPVSGYMCPKGGMISPIPPMGGMGPKASELPPGAAAAGGMGGMSHGAAPAAKSPGMGHSHSKRQFGMSVFIGGGGSVGSGNPFSTKPGSPIKSGYWIGKGNSMMLTSEIVNYLKTPQELYLTLDIEHSPGKDPDMYDVGMGAISADKCSDKEKGILHPPKDKAIIYEGEEWPVTDSGYFINFHPHIHDGGVNIKVWINGKEVCEAKAVYGDAGGTTKAPDGKAWQTITGYTPCEKPIKVKAGDKMKITSEYDLTKHRLRPDNQHADAEAEGMALANFIFAKPFSKGLFETLFGGKGKGTA